MNLTLRSNLFLMRFMAFAMASLPMTARADPLDKLGSVICGFIKPLIGQSKLISLIFIIIFAVFLFMWWMQENKEGPIVTIIRAGLAISFLINLETFPTLIGLPAPC